MNPYRGKLLATALFAAALPLLGCGDADKWETTTDIVISASQTTIVAKGEVTITVRSTAPEEGLACETLLEYRAEGAGMDRVWHSIPGTETTRLFELEPREAGVLSVVARGKCKGSREDYKYSAQIDITVTAPPPAPAPTLPTVTSVTLTAITPSPYSLAGAATGVSYTLSANPSVGCTVVRSRQHSGVASQTFNPTDSGTFTVLDAAITGVGTLTISASAWCAENPSAIVSATPLNITITL